MESLALEVSKILNITVEKAIELLPIIRSQFIRYSIIQSVYSPLSFTMAVVAILIIITATTYMFTREYLDDDSGFNADERCVAENTKRVLPMLVKVMVVLMILIAILNISKYMLAPDFMMIKEFILQ